MQNDLSYVPRDNHGDTAIDPYTGNVCLLIHITFTQEYYTGYRNGPGSGGIRSTGFFGYAKNGAIYLITNKAMPDFQETMKFSPRTVLVEKTKHLYASKTAYRNFIETSGIYNVYYDG